ncbi:MAG: AraC family transcriptional regulator [Bacteroidota bacterium]
MIFSFNEKSSTLLIFFVHGLVYAILLLKKGFEDQNTPSKYLGAFLLLCVLYICPFMLGYAGWYSTGGHPDIMFFVPFQQLFLIGPVFYFYTQSLLNKSFKPRGMDYLHFLPAVLYLIFSLIVFVTDKLILDEYYFYADGQDMDLDPWYQWAGLFSMLFYLILSLRYYRTYKNLAFQVTSYADAILFQWLQRFLLAFLLILILRVLFFILNPEWGQFGNKYWYYICFSLLFYYIAINGYSSTIKSALSFQTSFLNNEKLVLLDEKVKHEIKPLPQTEGAKTEMEDLGEWKQKLEALMHSGNLYENPRLSLIDISSQLDTTPKQVSQIVNQGFQKNFNDFVNQFRTEALIQKLQNGDHRKQTLLSLALDVGFNSKSTFNRAFKKHQGQTPREFLQELEEK